MGSRGSRPYELDRKEMQRYKIAGYVLDGEILAGKDKRNHTLPEVSHKPDVKYIKLNPDNSFRELRIYKNHRLILEIAYHSEKKLSGNYLPILHAHDINGEFYKEHPEARHLTEEEFIKYSPYFIGLNLEEVKR